MNKILLLSMVHFVFLQANFCKVNGVVSDHRTSLEWQDQYKGSVVILDWEHAIGYCERLALDGGGWRLPNKNELLSIVTYERSKPSIDSIFVNTKNTYYWSSTSYTRDKSKAWDIDFEYGSTFTNSKSQNYSVVCVRGGLIDEL